MFASAPLSPVFTAAPGKEHLGGGGDGGNPTPRIRKAGPKDRGEERKASHKDDAVKDNRTISIDEHDLIYAAEVAKFDQWKSEAYAKLMAAKLEKSRAELRKGEAERKEDDKVNDKKRDDEEDVDQGKSPQVQRWRGQGLRRRRTLQRPRHRRLALDVGQRPAGETEETLLTPAAIFHRWPAAGPRRQWRDRDGKHKTKGK